jgi:hypothetical protein
VISAVLYFSQAVENLAPELIYAENIMCILQISNKNNGKELNVILVTC